MSKYNANLENSKPESDEFGKISIPKITIETTDVYAEVAAARSHRDDVFTTPRVPETPYLPFHNYFQKLRQEARQRVQHNLAASNQEEEFHNPNFNVENILESIQQQPSGSKYEALEEFYSKNEEMSQQWKQIEKELAEFQKLRQEARQRVQHNLAASNQEEEFHNPNFNVENILESIQQQPSGSKYEALEEFYSKNEEMSQQWKQIEKELAEEILEQPVKHFDLGIKIPDSTKAKEINSNNNNNFQDIKPDATLETESHHLPNVNAATYELERFRRNAMIIFNHAKFSDGRVREGTDLDVKALKDTFSKFRFYNIETRDNRPRRQLFKELEEFSQQNFKSYGCICVVILTHGDDYGVLEAFDTKYNERDVFACFDTISNPTLVAKPIIFLIQACRGPDLADSVEVDPNAEPVELDSSIKKEKTYFLPTESDIIIFHSCFYGRGSARVRGKGTWFIQTVCEQINLYASTEHLEKISRRVRKIIAIDKEYNSGKQMPVTSSTLIRKLYLIRGDVDSAVDDNINSARALSEVDTSVDSTPKLNEYTKHIAIGLVFIVVYCSLSSLTYSPFIRRPIYFIISLLFFYLGRFNLSWSKMLQLLAVFLFLDFAASN